MIDISKLIAVLSKVSAILTFDNVKITKKTAPLFVSDYNWGYAIKYFLLLFWAIPWSIVIGYIFGFTILFWGLMQFYAIILLLFILTSKDYYILPIIYTICGFYFIYILPEKAITSTYVGYYKTISFIILNFLVAIFMSFSRQLKCFKVISNYVHSSHRPNNFKKIIFHHMTFCAIVFAGIGLILSLFTYIASRPVSSSKNYKVKFYNSNFEKAVREELDLDKNAVIMRSDLDKIKYINLSYNFVIFGDEYEYTRENCSDNDIMLKFDQLDSVPSADEKKHEFKNPLTNIKDLQHFRKLKYLQITTLDKSNNANPTSNKTKTPLVLYNLDDLQGLSNLQTLKITFSSHFTNIDNLKNLKSLKCLFLENQNIDDVSFLENMKHLDTLKISNINQTSNLDDIKKCKNLTFLSLNNCSLNNIDFLSNMNNLKYISLSKNNIKDISIFNDLKNVSYLNLGSNNISDISSLTTLEDLKYLVLLKNSNLEDISPIIELPNLSYIWLEDKDNYDLSDFKNEKIQIYTKNTNDEK